jgi:hypothetical protein
MKPAFALTRSVIWLAVAPGTCTATVYKLEGTPPILVGSQWCPLASRDQFVINGARYEVLELPVQFNKQ